MKKLLFLAISAVAVLALSGCGGGGDTYVVEPGPELITLFLVDETGIGVPYVDYTCEDAYGTIVADTSTRINGEFTFTAGERCTFDLYGFNGTVPNYEEPLFIVDDLDFGKEDIPYECYNDLESTDGVTDPAGGFDYPVDAYCKFYF